MHYLSKSQKLSQLYKYRKIGLYLREKNYFSEDISSFSSVYALATSL